MNNPSDSSLADRRLEIARLCRRISASEARMNRITDLLMDAPLLESSGSDSQALLSEWRSLNLRIEHDLASLARIKPEAELTEADRARRPPKRDWNDKNPVRY